MKKLAILLLLICTALFSISAYAGEAHASGIPKFKHAEPYSRVRAKMLRAGWKYYHVKDADDCIKGDTRCQGFPEMAHCTGLGMPFCEFTWIKGKKVIGICTAGEVSVYDNICCTSRRTCDPY